MKEKVHGTVWMGDFYKYISTLPSVCQQDYAVFNAQAASALMATHDRWQSRATEKSSNSLFCFGVGFCGILVFYFAITKTPELSLYQMIIKVFG